MGSIDICLSLSHLLEFSVTQSEFDVVVSLSNCQNSCVGEIAGYTHTIYLYSYDVTTYGYILTATLYSPTIQDAIERPANCDILQISLSTDAPTAFIPCHYSGCKIIRDEGLLPAAESMWHRQETSSGCFMSLLMRDGFGTREFEI